MSCSPSKSSSAKKKSKNIPDKQQEDLQDPKKQPTPKYFGVAIPRKILIGGHREIRKHIMNEQTNSQSSIKNSAINVHTKAEMQIRDVSEYEPIFVKDLLVGVTHSQRVLRAKIVELPCVMDGLHVIVEDLNGDCLQVTIFNTNIVDFRIADKVFQVGYELAVYDPFVGAFSQGGIGIGVDDPKYAYIGPPRPDFEHIDFQHLANQALKNQQFEQALKFYTKALKKKEQIAKLLGNISNCLLKQADFLGALLYAYCSVRIDEFYGKGWFRLSEAAKQLGYLDEWESTYRFAPEDVQNAFNFPEISKVKIKNNTCDAMASFLSSHLDNFVLPTSQDLKQTHNFEELKTQGNEYFRKLEITSALNCYINALDLEKDQISTLLKCRAECYLNLEEYLKAAIDASASYLIQNVNSEEAVFLRASALREMGKFKVAIQCIRSENYTLTLTPIPENATTTSTPTTTLSPTPQLLKLFQELEIIEDQQFPNLKNHFKILHARKDAWETQDRVIPEETLQQLLHLKKLATKRARDQMEGLMRDARVPNFIDEYLQGGYLPPHCDQKLCETQLLRDYEYSIRATKKLEMEKFIFEATGDSKFLEMYSKSMRARLGNPTKERIKWWYESEVKGLNLLERPGQYVEESLQSFSNAFQVPIELMFGAVHVSVGYVDLGELLIADLYGEEETDMPVFFIGYEQSVYCTAKATVIVRLLGNQVDPNIILQVWYSSGWSLKTLQHFRSTVAALLSQGGLDQEVEELLRYWLAAPRIPLLEAQKLWLKHHPEQSSLAANVINQQDRIKIITYLLTGRLLDCKVGSTVMFANPPSYPHPTYNEKITYLLKEHEILEYYKECGTIIGTFIIITLGRIKSLSENISQGNIVIELRRASVTPTDEKIQKEIKEMSPYTINWSNLVDYYGISEFHKMAQSCSAEEDTVHFMHSENWVYDVKGAMALDYPFHQQYELYNNICKGYLTIENDLRKVFLIPPVDNPWSLCDGYLTLDFSLMWAEKFYEEGGVIEKNILGTQSYPHSIFSRGQGQLYLRYTYDKNIDFSHMKI